MTSLEFHKMLLDRFGEKLDMDIESVTTRKPDRAKQNKIRIYFPSDMRLDFIFGNGYGMVEIRCVFLSGIQKVVNNRKLEKSLFAEFYNGDVDNPFEWLAEEFDVDKVEYEVGICLSSVISKNDLTMERIDEYVKYITHPTPFMRKLIKLSREF